MFLLRDAIYLIELAFYGPLVPAVVFILLIHGLKAPYTWRPIILPLFLLAGLRIAGASLGLAAMNPDKSNLLTTATLLDTIGLAPVLCLLVGLLIRANAPLYKGISFWVFLPLQLTVIAATVMTAFGGHDLYTAGDNRHRDVTLMRAGIFIFIGVFTATVFLAGLTFVRVSRCLCHRTERTAVACVLMCIPFMSIRLAFSVGSLFTASGGGGDKGTGSVLNPMSDDNTDVWVHFFMVIIMEYVAALSTTAVSLTAKKKVAPSLPPEKDLDMEKDDDY